jgi:lipoprotein-anchoring transpeptidase ErfK/SrfK
MLVWREMVPFGIDMPTINGEAAVDPRINLDVDTIGVGTRLTSVQLRDDSGAILSDSDGTGGPIHSPLDFATHYTLKASAERAWLNQRTTREISFTTIEIPKVETPLQQTLAPDGSISLKFDRAVGAVKVSNSELKMDVQPEAGNQSYRLVASNFEQGRTYPAEVSWETSTGVPLPPIKLELTAAPPLSAEINNAGKSDLGLAMPLQVTFSEPLADKDSAGKSITIRKKEGGEIAGKWKWINKRRLQFVPEPGWPALSTIDVKVEQSGLKSLQGGFLSQPIATSFTTGPDKRILVSLDAQRAIAIENGQVVKTLRVSTGKAATPTVTGNFYIYARFPTKTMKSRAKPGQKGHYVVEGVPYAQYFYEDYALHGAWWHNGFGHPASHGCVNLSTKKKNNRWPGAAEDAGWLYHWAALGVPVTVQKHRPEPTQMAAMQ